MPQNFIPQTHFIDSPHIIPFQQFQGTTGSSAMPIPQYPSFPTGQNIHHIVENSSSFPRCSGFPQTQFINSGEMLPFPIMTQPTTHIIGQPYPQMPTAPQNIHHIIEESSD